MKTKTPRRSTARQEMELANKEIVQNLRKVTKLFQQFPKTSRRMTAQLGSLYNQAATELSHFGEAASAIARKLNV